MLFSFLNDLWCLQPLVAECCVTPAVVFTPPVDYSYAHGNLKLLPAQLITSLRINPRMVLNEISQVSGFSCQKAPGWRAKVVGEVLRKRKPGCADIRCTTLFIRAVKIQCRLCVTIADKRWHKLIGFICREALGSVIIPLGLSRLTLVFINGSLQISVLTR